MRATPVVLIYQFHSLIYIGRRGGSPIAGDLPSENTMCEGTPSYDELFVGGLLSRGHGVNLFTTFSALLYRNRDYVFVQQYLGVRNLQDLIIHNKPLGHKNPLLIAFLLKRLLDKVKPDVLDANYLQSYVFYSALMRHHPLVPVSWGSDLLVAPKKRMRTRMMAKFSLKSADFVAANSEIQKHTAVALGYSPNRIECFPWGVDLEQYSPVSMAGC